MGRRFLPRVACVVALALAGQTPAPAQTFPTKPITVLVGLPAGGSVNVVMAHYGEVMGKSLGQRLLVDNKPGAGGITAALALKQAAPDGYTIMIALGGLHTIAPAMQDLPFDPINDFEPVTLLYTLPGYLAVPGNRPANSVKELLAYGKSKPNGLNFGSQSVGSPGHLMGEILAEKSGVSMTHIAYRGGGPMAIDLIAGRIDFAFPTSVNALQPAKDGQLKLLAIIDSKRFSGTPDVPTLDEAGYPGVAIDNLFGVMAPKGTPKAVIARLNEEFAKASRDPELIKKMNDLALVIRATPPEALTAAFQADLERLGRVVRDHGIKAE
jgi:tripartite-type tricarboxylate transporter receptor subunit TctC